MTEKKEKGYEKKIQKNTKLENGWVLNCILVLFCEFGDLSADAVSCTLLNALEFIIRQEQGARLMEWSA